MGIEDFSLDMAEHTDRVLLLTEKAAEEEKLIVLLQKREYTVTHAQSLASALELAKRSLYDILVCEQPSGMPSAKAFLAAVLEAPKLANTPIILITNDPEGYKLAENNHYLNVLPSPVGPADLLVKMTTSLRLRKMQAAESRAESTISAQNTQLRDLTNRFKHELQEAKTIQQQLLPATLPQDAKCLFAASYDPLEAVGGDLYDIWKIRDSVYGLFIGDVTGHGLSAAFIGAMTKMSLSYASKESASQMLKDMNEGICDHMPEGNFVTVAAAIYDSSSRKLQVARGGHPPPYIWRKSTGEVEQIAPDGFALGFLSGVDYEGYETTLEPGDKGCNDY